MKTPTTTGNGNETTEHTLTDEHLVLTIQTTSTLSLSLRSSLPALFSSCHRITATSAHHVV